jgi:superfamily II DNA or RNA helicase
MRRRQELLSRIAREESRLASLQAEVENSSQHLSSLRRELASLPSEQITTESYQVHVLSSVPTDNTAKIALFRSLFRGREDVFPRRWENLRNGKSGYSPTCANEWEYGLCAKRKGPGAARRATCGECPNQAFVAVSDEEVARHLRGDQVIGVYPLLSNETCWFLAADFDKQTWREDVAAFVETCGIHRVPVAIERSRSGNGAHAWFFFASPVQAKAARQLGCFLITETMARRHQFSMESYDRLFPNQDTMPKGGFGNLIALPLQRKAREAGNAVFIDGSFKPWADQWAFLAGVKPLDVALVYALVDEANRQGQVMGVRMSDIFVDGDSMPWNRPPSGRPAKPLISDPLPSKVEAILGQRLFIEKTGLPSSILNQLKRLAAFQNPEFYKKQNLRLSTALTPRIIACAEEFPKHIALPRGCLAETETLFQEHDVALEIEDRREEGTALDIEFHGALTAVQEQAVQALLQHDTGVFVAPPGVGKTVVGTYLVAARRKSTLIIVHRRPLLEQWIGQLSLFLGIDPRAIGQIGAGRSKPNGSLDVAMMQSLVRKGVVADLVAAYGQVIQDEAHHVPAVSFERVLAEVKARYIVGLTATPQRRDGLHPILHMQLGPIRFAVDARSPAARQPFNHRLIVRETDFALTGSDNTAGIQELYRLLAMDPRRNDLIFNDVVHSVQEKRSPILLTERRDHLEHFAERLRGVTRHLVALHGGMKSKERREALARLASIPKEEGRLLLATGRYIGEGFDDERLDTLFLALPVSWKGTLIQYAGRLHRLHPGKAEVQIFDYVDRAVPMLAKMFNKRLRGYRAIGYTRDDAPFGLQEQVTENEIIAGRNEEPFHVHEHGR